jgi:hypothetical protein
MGKLRDVSERYAPGTPVLLREVWQGKVWTLRPVTVVRDDPDVVMLYIPHGVPWRGAVTLGGEILRVPWEPWGLAAPKPWFNHVLRFCPAGAPYSVSLVWHESWYAFGWYINVEEPVRRSEFGFDYMDWTLDVMVSKDRQYHKVKDADELAEAVRRGVYTGEHAAEIHVAAERGLEHLTGYKPPFNEDYERWRPDPAWPLPGLPERWE